MSSILHQKSRDTCRRFRPAYPPFHGVSWHARCVPHGTSAKQVVRQLIPVWLFGWALLLSGPVGCGRSDMRQPITGTVTIDVQPLGDGAVNFRPAAGTVGPSTGGPVHQGKFSVPAENGLVPGTYVVTVLAVKKTGRMVQDPQKGTVPERVQLKFKEPPGNVTVVAGERNAFEFALTTSPR